MPTMNDLTPLLRRRRTVITDQGDKVGAIGVVFLDDATDEPTWVTVHTGLFGTRESFVPLRGAVVEGDHLVVAYPRDLIRHAPSTERDGHLSPEDEHGLYRHYGLIAPTTEVAPAPAVGAATTATAPASVSTTAPAPAPVTAPAPTAGEVTAGEATTATVPASVPATTSAVGTAPATERGGALPEGRDGGEPWMVRSEERLRVGTERYEAARVRLRKYVVTEEVAQTVPLRKEELRVEREPIEGTMIDAADGGSLFREEVVEMVGREEHAVVGKEAVAVERVRFGKATVAGRATVTEQVRKERIATDISDIPGPRGSAAGTRSPAGGDPGAASGAAARRVPLRRPETADEQPARIATNSPNAIMKGRKKRR